VKVTNQIFYEEGINRWSFTICKI